MIAALAEELSRQAAAADLLHATDVCHSLALDAGGDVLLESCAVAGLHVRVMRQGRVGWAGGDGDRPRDVLDAALRAARAGEVLDLMLPAPAPLPDVATVAPSGPVAARDLLPPARALRARLARPGRRVEVWAEHASGAVTVASTRGVTAGYFRAVAGLGAVVRGAGLSGGAALRVETVGTTLPGPGAIEGLAREADRWLRFRELEQAPRGPQRAWLLPAAVRTLLGPLLLRLAGEAWARPAVPPPDLDPRLTLVDDPHAPARPGSRPVCDDGVPTRPLVLVQDGRPCRGIVDLLTAARTGLPATGHGVRRALGAPRAGFSNLVLQAGPAGPDRLAAALGDGLLVRELPWGPAPSREGAVFRAHAPWTFLVRGGEVVGRLPDVILSGNALDLLRQVVEVGADAGWQGAWRLPSLVVEGLVAGG
jgi:PmbA protein